MPEYSLQLKLSQKLALAPQLQQAIRLLQLTRLELREYIQETVEANPLLEQVEPGESEQSTESEPESQPLDEYQEEASFSDDYDWESVSDSWPESTAYTGDFPEPQIVDDSTGSLREHLLWQINLGHFSASDAAIAAAIVYALDEDGFLDDDIEDIRASLAPDLLVDADEVLAVLHRIQPHQRSHR